MGRQRQVWGVAKDLFEGDSGTSELQPNATVPADVGRCWQRNMVISKGFTLW